jgi:hypothetical protein
VLACVRACVHVALLMRHVVTSFVAPVDRLYFGHLTNGAIFDKKKIQHKMCVLIVSTSLCKNISHSKKNLARYCHKCENVFV